MSGLSIRGLTLAMHCRTPSLGSPIDFASVLSSIRLAELAIRTTAARSRICFINRYELLLNHKIIFPQSISNYSFLLILSHRSKKKAVQLDKQPPYKFTTAPINQTQQMTETKRINPELSVINQKNQLKKLDSNVETMKNRVELLRQQLQKEKDNVKKHRQLTKDVIQKKVEVNKINQWKQKDNSEENEKVEQLRRRNQQLRMSHEKELQDIQKAIYLVKLDDAREVKNISMEHTKRLKEMDREFLSGQREKKRKVAEESQQAKEKYMLYWKDKLAGIYTEQAQTIIEVGKRKEEDKRELQKLEDQELKLMEEINQYHSKGVESKKQYLAALSLPIKDVAEAMGNSSQNASQFSRRKSMTLNNSGVEISQSLPSARYGEVSSSKMPNAQVNQDKLKIILQQLKKIDRSHTSK